MMPEEENLPIDTYPEAAEKFKSLAEEIDNFLRKEESYEISQFSIDLLEGLRSELLHVNDEYYDNPRKLFFNLNMTMGATCYYLENLLSVMDKEKPDYAMVERILEQYNKYSKIDYFALL